MPLLFLSQLAHVEELLSELGPGEEDGDGDDADEDWENVESTDEEEEIYCMDYSEASQCEEASTSHFLPYKSISPF